MAVEEGIVRAVVGRSGLTEEQVRLVLDAWVSYRSGDPTGTIVQDPATQAVGVRIVQDGLPLWYVVGLDGSVWKDQNPRLEGWDVIKSA